MKRRGTFNLLFYIKKSQPRKTGLCPVMGRITIDKYSGVYTLLKEFIRYRYNRSDIALKEIQPAFITDFEFFLRTEKPLPLSGKIIRIWANCKMCCLQQKTSFAANNPLAPAGSKTASEVSGLTGSTGCLNELYCP